MRGRSATTGRSSSPFAIPRYQAADLPKCCCRKASDCCSQIRARLDAEPLHPCRRDRADAVKLRDRQRCDEVRAHLGRDDKLAVRLAVAGRELGEELVVGDARRGREAGLLEDARANFLSGRRGGRQAAQVLRDVEIGLVERQRLDQRRVIRKDRVDLARDGAIDVEARPHEHQFGALAHRRGRRHRRAHAEGAGLVARRGDDASLGAVADRDGTPSKRRIVALLDRRIEGVHVDVDDLAHRHAATLSTQEQKENSGRARSSRGRQMDHNVTQFRLQGSGMRQTLLVLNGLNQRRKSERSPCATRMGLSRTWLRKSDVKGMKMNIVCLVERSAREFEVKDAPVARR